LQGAYKLNFSFRKLFFVSIWAFLSVEVHSNVLHHLLF
jgi:hypothetical protein